MGTLSYLYVLDKGILSDWQWQNKSSYDMMEHAIYSSLPKWARPIKQGSYVYGKIPMS